MAYKQLSTMAVGSTVSLGTYYNSTSRQQWKIIKKNDSSGYPSNAVLLQSRQSTSYTYNGGIWLEGMKSTSTGSINDDVEECFKCSQWKNTYARNALNSSKEAVTWTPPSANVDPPIATNGRGFLYHFTEAEIDQFVSVSLTSTQTFTFDPSVGSDVKTVRTSTSVDKVFLPSLDELTEMNGELTETRLRDAQFRASSSNWNIGSPKLMQGNLEYPLAYVYGDALVDGSTITEYRVTSGPQINSLGVVQGGLQKTISWTAAGTVNCSVSSYILEKSVDSGAWSQIYSGTQTSYTDTIAYGSSTVKYRVKAIISVGDYATGYSTTPAANVDNNTMSISLTPSSWDALSMSHPPTSYTVTDPNHETVTSTVKIDDDVISNGTASTGDSYSISIPFETLVSLKNGSHTLSVTTEDGDGHTKTASIEFTRSVSTVKFTLAEPLPADAMPLRAIVTINGQFPTGSVLKVYVCNNGNDDAPTWEDITEKALNSEKHIFANDQKTAEDWGVDVKVELSRGTAVGACYVYSLSGAYE